MPLKGHSLSLHSFPLKLSQVSVLSERLKKAVEATRCPSTHINIRHVCSSSCVSIVGRYKRCSCLLVLQTYCHLSTNKKNKNKKIHYWHLLTVFVVIVKTNGVINYGRACRRGESVAQSSPEYSLWKAKLRTIEHGYQIHRWPLCTRLCTSPEISLESNSVQTLQKSFRWNYKQRSPMCIRMQKEHIHVVTWHVTVWWTTETTK